MPGGFARAAAWSALAAGVLSAGLAAWLGAAALWLGAGAGPERVQQLQAAFLLYGVVVLGKGLLPALVLAVALCALAERARPLRARGRAGVAAAIALASLLASLVATGLLLPFPIGGSPAVRFQGTWHFAQSAAEMAVAVALALGISRVLLARLASRRAASAPHAVAPEALGPGPSRG